MSKAISPKQVAEQKAASFPDYVFEAFNELIASNFTCGSAVIKQPKVVELILQKANVGANIEDFPVLTKNDIFSRGYLNVEEVYQAQGWCVSYDKPRYNEAFDSFFTFKE